MFLEGNVLLWENQLHLFYEVYGGLEVSGLCFFFFIYSNL